MFFAVASCGRKHLQNTKIQNIRLKGENQSSFEEVEINICF